MSVSCCLSGSENRNSHVIRIDFFLRSSDPAIGCVSGIQGSSRVLNTSTRKVRTLLRPPRRPTSSEKPRCYASTEDIQSRAAVFPCLTVPYLCNSESWNSRRSAFKGICFHRMLAWKIFSFAMLFSLIGSTLTPTRPFPNNPPLNTT